MTTYFSGFPASDDLTRQQHGSGRPGVHTQPSHTQNEDANEETALREKQMREDGSPEEESARRDLEVHELARIYSTRSGKELNPFDDEAQDTKVDPSSKNFSPRAWTKALLALENQEPNKFKKRTAGFSFRNLNVYGFGASTDYQTSVGNIVFQVVGLAKKLLGRGQRRIDILQGLDGVVHAGEMLVVLGPPGSGCTTFLKAISGDTHGFFIDKESHINYQGIPPDRMQNDFRGEAIYTAEVDAHFPQMTVGQTLLFAALARAPRTIPGGVRRDVYATFCRDAIMASFGIQHTMDTRVGNDFVRGVSGGERKRVTIAEAALSGAPLQCWDNSTRGLDSANAIEFCRTLRMSTELRESTACVSIYQSPQSAYDVFDKVIVLYEGRQIFFGGATKAKDYFIKLGFDFPERSTVADFLTSMTRPQQRIVSKGYNGRAPYSPDEFAAAWKQSAEYKALQQELDDYDKTYPLGGEALDQFRESRRVQQAKLQRTKSPYTLSYFGQIALCLRRGFWRLKADPTLTFVQLFSNGIMALVVSSIFFNLPQATSSFYRRGALIFFAILLNAFGSALEILTLYAARPIIEKHSRYAFYHPSTEAFASMLTDIPYKTANSILFNIILYFMTNLRRTPGAFFFFVFVSYILTLTMSMLFRCIASLSRTLSQAMAPAAILILGIVTYTGFTIPVPHMRGWARWIQYVNPVSYGFESLMINEFYNQNYPCSQFIPSQIIPGYDGITSTEQVCTAFGSVAGQSFTSGTSYLSTSFEYYHSHKWRNVGIIFVFMIGLCAVYLLATEFISAKKSKGEVLVFRRGHRLLKETAIDEETGAKGRLELEKNKTDASHIIERQTAIFHWKDVCFDIKVKGGHRRLLDHVDGWVKPGTLTALMGVSGAGKTTLLDVLASRTTVGVITGEMLVDGKVRDESFQRKTGYVQQADLHLETTTVREALNFSALLRQPANIPRQEKLDYVSDVIKLLDMDEYADAVVGVPGEGLNVEQRKRLTIGVELAAKPALLLFLDEPSSGLDSETAFAILELLEKLQKNGQAILCTIHQPSALLFQRFDRLLFLAKGGRPVYFGEVGEGAHKLIKYFESNGAIKCPPDANPAEWMLQAIGAAPGSKTDVDWPQIWLDSPERVAVHEHLDELKRERPALSKVLSKEDSHKEDYNKEDYREFAAPLLTQNWEVTKRVFQQYWRTPSYIYSKFSLCLFSSLFIGFSFYHAGTGQQELQNQMFSIFLLFTIFGQLVQQIMPHFVTQRTLYEARERPSKAYSWKAFMLANITVELPWNTLMAVIIFICFYYPIGLYRNAEPTNAVTERSGLFFLLVLQFLLFTSTFTNMVIAAVETAESGGNIANLLFSLTLIFNGVLVSPEALPGFWIFMYRVSPFTYLVSAMLGTGLANQDVVCDSNEFLNFQPRSGQNCGDYMRNWTDAYGGYVDNPSSNSDCRFCQISRTNTFLDSVSSPYSYRWRNFGIMWVFIIFNIFAALFLYWLVRVPRKSRAREVSTTATSSPEESLALVRTRTGRSRTSKNEKSKKGGLSALARGKLSGLRSRTGGSTNSERMEKKDSAGASSASSAMPASGGGLFAEQEKDAFNEEEEYSSPRYEPLKTGGANVLNSQEKGKSAPFHDATADEVEKSETGPAAERVSPVAAGATESSSIPTPLDDSKSGDVKIY